MSRPFRAACPRLGTRRYPMSYLAGAVRLTLIDLPPWAWIVVIALVCGTRIAIAALRSDGPLVRVMAEAMTDWLRRHRH